MTNARDIKRRIKSVQSTQQITKAMKMISAAKLRKSQASVQAVRPFTAKIEQIIRDTLAAEPEKFEDVMEEPMQADDLPDTLAETDGE